MRLHAASVCVIITKLSILGIYWNRVVNCCCRRLRGGKRQLVARFFLTCCQNRQLFVINPNAVTLKNSQYLYTMDSKYCVLFDAKPCAVKIWMLMMCLET